MKSDLLPSYQWNGAVAIGGHMSTVLDDSREGRRILPLMLVRWLTL